MKYSILRLGLALSSLPTIGCGGAVYELGPGSDAEAASLDADVAFVSSLDGLSPAQDTQPPPELGPNAAARGDAGSPVEPMIASGATDASDIGIDATTNEGSASSTADSTIDATRAATIDVTTASTIDAVAAAASPFCTLAPHRFCDDFDEGPLAGRWSALSQTGGIVALDSTTSISRPNSLIVQFSPLSSPNVLDTGLSETLPMPRPPATIVWDFQFQAVSIDSTANNGAVIGALDSFDDARNRYGSTRRTMACIYGSRKSPGSQMARSS